MSKLIESLEEVLKEYKLNIDLDDDDDDPGDKTWTTPAEWKAWREKNIEPVKQADKAIIKCIITTPNNEILTRYISNLDTFERVENRAEAAKTTVQKAEELLKDKPKHFIVRSKIRHIPAAARYEIEQIKESVQENLKPEKKLVKITKDKAIYRIGNKIVAEDLSDDAKMILAWNEQFERNKPANDEIGF